MLPWLFLALVRVLLSLFVFGFLPPCLGFYLLFLSMSSGPPSLLIVCLLAVCLLGGLCAVARVAHCRLYIY